jgi:hypothetical protein
VALHTGNQASNHVTKTRHRESVGQRNISMKTVKVLQMRENCPRKVLRRE